MSGRKREYNIVLLGALGVGKSALTVKYITKRFIMEYDPYIEDVYTKHEDVDGQEFVVNVMDTYEKDDMNSQRYLRWADAFMVVYSITARSSFDTAKEYITKVSEYLKNASKDCPIALVGNKCDLERYRQISKADGQTLACEYDGLFYECTAAEEYEYVEGIFHGLVHAIQLQRGERSLMFISDDSRYHSATQRGRPRSPRNSAEKKDDKTQNKKNATSFKLFNKSFKIFN
ncbi:Ras-like protein member 12 [Mactra antiquata]